MDRRKQIDDIIFRVYGQDESYDKLRHNLLRCYDTMSRDVKGFTRLSLSKQYDIVLCAATIAIGSSHQLLREHRPLTPTKNHAEILS